MPETSPVPPRRPSPRATARVLTLALVAVGLAVAGPASRPVAAQEVSAIDGSGSLFSLRVEPRSEPNSRLVLEVERPDAEPVTYLVPGTDDANAEIGPSIVAPEGAERVFLLWQSRSPGYHSALRLAAFEPATASWTESIEIVVGPWSTKSAPQLVVTTDRVANPERAGSTLRRSVLHTLWAEELTTGGYETYYAPVILIEGRPAGQPALYRLGDFDPSAPANLAFDVPSALLQAPRIEPGRDGRSVTATFAQADRRRVTAVEIDVLPDEVVRLADEARSGVIILGARGGSRAKLAEDLAVRMREKGGAFVAEIRDGAAEAMRQLVLTNPDTPLHVLAAEARSGVIILGSRNRDRGLTRAAESLSTTFTEPKVVSSEDPLDPRNQAVLRLSVAASRPALRIGAGAIEARFMTSPDGQRTAVAWWDTAAVHYRITEGNGWGDPAEIRLTPRMPLERALAVLGNRMRPQ